MNNNDNAARDAPAQTEPNHRRHVATANARPAAVTPKAAQ